MTTPTTHEDGTSRRRVSDDDLARVCRIAEMLGVFSHGETALGHDLALDLRDARAQVADLTRQLEERTAAYRKLVATLDEQLGTPCEQIRHQQEVDDLKRALAYKEERRQYWHHEASKENARADKAEVALRDREQRGGQVTGERLAAALLAYNGVWNAPREDGLHAGNVDAVREEAMRAALAACPIEYLANVSKESASVDTSDAHVDASDTTTHVFTLDNTPPQDTPCDRGTITREAVAVEFHERVVEAWSTTRALLKRRANCNGGWWNDGDISDLEYKVNKPLAAAIRARNEEGRDA